MTVCQNCGRPVTATEPWRAVLRDVASPEEVAIVHIVHAACLGWQTMENAPNDGGYTYVILRCRRPDHTCVGTFYNGKWKPIHADKELHPTHWMPLPEPPKE